MSYREKYWRRAKLAGRILRWVPFLRLAGLNGSIVRGEEKKESDIDFLIIARSGRLYTARVFATAFIHLTGWRRQGKKIAGRICLNCYLSDKNPDISPKNPKSRLKVARAYKYLVPLVDSGGTLSVPKATLSVAEKFFKVNRWFDRELSAISPACRSSTPRLPSTVSSGQSNCRLEEQAGFSHQVTAFSNQLSVLKYKNKLQKKLIPNGPRRPVRFLEIYLRGKFGNWVEEKLMSYQRRRILAGRQSGDETVATKNEIRLHPRKTD